MKPINGATIDFCPFKLSKIAELIFDEYSYLSLWRDQYGADYLKYWYDKNHTHDRWLIFEISSNQLSNFLARIVSLHSLLISPKKGLIYAADESFDGTTHRILITSPRELDQTCLPSPESIYEEEPIRVCQTTRRKMKVAIDGDWGFEDMTMFPRWIREAYSFLAVFWQPESARSITNYPMNDGFSTKHFFGQFRKLLSNVEDIKLESISYASPGAFTFDANTKVADLFIEVVRNIENSKEDAQRFYHHLKGTLQQEKLLGENAKKTLVNPDLDLRLKTDATHLLQLMKMPNPASISEFAPTGLQCAKVALAYYRLIAERILGFKRNGKATFPPFA